MEYINHTANIKRNGPPFWTIFWEYIVNLVIGKWLSVWNLLWKYLVLMLKKHSIVTPFCKIGICFKRSWGKKKKTKKFQGIPWRTKHTTHTQLQLSGLRKNYTPSWSNNYFLNADIYSLLLNVSERIFSFQKDYHDIKQTSNIWRPRWSTKKKKKITGKETALIRFHCENIKSRKHM